MTPDDEKALRVGRAVLGKHSAKEGYYRRGANDLYLGSVKGAADLYRTIADAIVEPEREIEVWLNIYQHRRTAYLDKELADKWAGLDRIACVRVPVRYRPGQHDGEVG